MEFDTYKLGILLKLISQLVYGFSQERGSPPQIGGIPTRVERISERQTEIVEVRQPRRLGCPEGTDKSLKEEKCFIFVSTAKSFIDAQDYCQKQYGNLASIRSGFDNHLLADHGREHFRGQMFYIGASTINSGTETYKWFDGTLLQYSNWVIPVTSTDAQIFQCVTMNPLNRGVWHPTDCFRKLAFVCEIPMVEI
uniref:C-type lectin domain-containing protein n=1 Tax=Panagrolaimus sp. PS1159 TaxID=55785 RepID=A0AC35G3F7_9BILA